MTHTPQDELPVLLYWAGDHVCIRRDDDTFASLTKDDADFFNALWQSRAHPVGAQVVVDNLALARLAKEMESAYNTEHGADGPRPDFIESAKMKLRNSYRLEDLTEEQLDVAVNAIAAMKGDALSSNAGVSHSGLSEAPSSPTPQQVAALVEAARRMCEQMKRDGYISAKMQARLELSAVLEPFIVGGR